jgi:hypothetical protein
MENVFLAVIAFNALLSLVIVGGIAFGMRLVNRKLDDLEADVEGEVLPKLRDLTTVAGRVAEATADARRRALRVEARLAGRTQKAGRLVGGTLDQVTGVMEDVADTLEARAAAASAPLTRSVAVLEGLRRGLAAWRAR